MLRRSREHFVVGPLAQCLNVFETCNLASRRVREEKILEATANCINVIKECPNIMLSIGEGEGEGETKGQALITVHANSGNLPHF